MGANHVRRRKVLLNALSARRGGGQTYVVNVLRFLPEEASAEVFVLAPHSLPLPTDRRNIKKVPVNWPVENPFVRAAWEKVYLPKLVRALKAEVLFCPGGIIGASLPPGCKGVTMFRNMVPFDPVQRQKYPLGYMRMRNWILKRVMLRSMLQADLVICVSDFARKVLEEHAHAPLKNTVVIPHGVNLHFGNSAGADLHRPGWLPAEDYLLYVSNVDFYKAQVEVVQAYALLKQRRETREKLVLVGPEFPDYARKVRAEIHRLGLKCDVLLTGRVPYDEMPGSYHHALLNIFASECENCPNILLEAMAAGRPLLVSNRPPMPEFAGDAAVYFDPRSPHELADKLASVLENPLRMKELAARAMERSLLYDWRRTARLTWKAIEELSHSSN